MAQDVVHAETDNVNPEFPDCELIKRTIADLDETLARLADERDVVAARLEDVDRRASEVKERRDKWASHLLRLQELAEGKPKRRKKGEAERLIQGLLRDSATGLSIPEISGKTGIAWSSVRNVMERWRKAGIAAESGNLWRLVKSQEVAA